MFSFFSSAIDFFNDVENVLSYYWNGASDFLTTFNQPIADLYKMVSNMPTPVSFLLYVFLTSIIFDFMRGRTRG